MMSEQDLADVVQIAVEDLNPDHPGTVGGSIDTRKSSKMLSSK